MQIPQGNAATQRVARFAIAVWVQPANFVAASATPLAAALATSAGARRSSTLAPRSHAPRVVGRRYFCCASASLPKQQIASVLVAASATPFFLAAGAAPHHRQGRCGSSFPVAQSSGVAVHSSVPAVAAAVPYHGTFSRTQCVKRMGLGAAGGAGIAGAEMEDGKSSHLVRRKPRVVIIGAGMAGIAAAQRLQGAAGGGQYDLTVLEASERIGGRICSSEFNGEGIELGATWIHGIEGSPLYETALRIGAMSNSERAWEGKDGFLDNALVKAEGGMEVASELVDPVVEMYKLLLQEAQEMGVVQAKEMVAGAAVASAPMKISDFSNCTSVGAYLQQGLDMFIAQQGPDHHNPQGGEESAPGTQYWTPRNLQKGCFKMHENLERNITSADDLYNMDLVDYNEYWEFPGEHKTIGKGYSSVVHELASTLPPGAVQFGKKVEKIVWNGPSSPSYPPDSPVNVHCEGGSVVEADHVILTVSLGVLKAKTLGAPEASDVSGDSLGIGNSVALRCPGVAAPVEAEKQCGLANGESADVGEFFDPPLPKWKLDSIARLGFGVVDKVFAQIQPAEEGAQHRPIQFIFDPRATTSEQSEAPWWIRKTFSLYPIHAKSHALVAWFAGKEALQVESLSDEEIVQGISKTLTSFGIPESQQGTILGIRRSGWGQNPLFRGSYSYVKVGATGEDIDALAEPLPKLGDTRSAPLQVLFAGEATHRHYYSTTHGAYFSGLREAERLLKHYGLLA